MQGTRSAHVFALVIILVALSIPAFAQDGGQVLATVNGEPITADTFQDELIMRWGDVALGALIQERAVQQAAAEAGVSVTDEEVNQRFENFQQNIDLQARGTGRSFSLWLAEKKMTQYAFRQWIRNEMLIEKMVEGDVTVTDEEVRQVWEASQEDLRQPERMRISHICVKTKEEADKIRSEILEGKPFAEAAQEYSIDPYTKDNGGEFGVISPGDNPFQQAAFELGADNEMTEPVQTEMGWHIIRRDEYMPASVPEFDEVKDDIRERIRNQKLLQAMNRKRSEIMQSAQIEHKMEPEQLVD